MWESLLLRVWSDDAPSLKKDERNPHVTGEEPSSLRVCIPVPHEIRIRKWPQFTHVKGRQIEHVEIIWKQQQANFPETGWSIFYFLFFYFF